MKTVLVFGTFDIIHPGHRWFLRQAASHGDRIVAVVSRDRFVSDWKGSPPVTDENMRRSSLISSGLVDDAVLSDLTIRTYGVLERLVPDIICLGHDQKALKDDLESYLDQRVYEFSRPTIIVLKPWKRGCYSSSRLNRPLRGVGAESRDRGTHSR